MSLFVSTKYLSFIWVLSLIYVTPGYAYIEREGCRDELQFSDAYTSDFPIREQVALVGGYECRCLPGATHPDLAHGHRNTYAQVEIEDREIVCRYQVSSEASLREKIALKSCNNIISSIEGLILLEEIFEFKKCLESKLK